MLHGTSHCAPVWDFAAKALSDQFHVMCFDQRGHGDSDAPGFAYTFDQLGHDLVEIIRRLGLDGVYILAHSSGGFASIIADSLQPGSIGRAVLVETRMTRRTQGSVGQERVGRTRQKRSVWESRDSLYQSYRSRSAFASWEEGIFRDFIDGCTKVLEDGRFGSCLCPALPPALPDRLVRIGHLPELPSILPTPFVDQRNIG